MFRAIVPFCGRNSVAFSKRPDSSTVAGFRQPRAAFTNRSSWQRQVALPDKVKTREGQTKDKLNLIRLDPIRPSRLEKIRPLLRSIDLAAVAAFAEVAAGARVVAA